MQFLRLTCTAFIYPVLLSTLIHLLSVDYLYQVTANNSAGSSQTSWVIGTTREAPPSGVNAPYYAQATSGYNIGLYWSKYSN